MPRFPIPRQDCFDTNGAPRAGAKLYFYTTGTTTPLATYADSALVTPNANPVIADSAGLFGEIFLTQTAVYKVVLKTSADVVVWTADPVPGGTTAADLTGLINAAAISNTVSEQQAIVNKLQFIQAGAGAVTRTVRSKMREPVSVVDFGATADGSTDDKAAFSYADAFSGYLVPPGTYAIASNLTITAAVQFAPGAILKPANGITITLSGEIVAGAWQIFDISAGGTIVGPVRNALVYPDWWGAAPGVASSQTSKIQAAITFAQNGARTVYLRNGLWRCDTALTITEPCSIVGDPGIAAQSVTSATSALDFSHAASSVNGLVIGRTTDFPLDGITLKDIAIYRDTLVAASTGCVGLSLDSVLQAEVVNVQVWNWDRSYALTGSATYPCSQCVFTGCRSQYAATYHWDIWSAIDSVFEHCAAAGGTAVYCWYVYENVISGAAAPNALHWTNCICVSSGTEIGIRILAGFWHSIEDCVFESTSVSGILVSMATTNTALLHVSVSDCWFNNCGSGFSSIGDGGNFRIRDNRIEATAAASKYGIIIDSSTGLEYERDILIEGNNIKVTGATSAGISINRVTGARVINNRLIGLVDAAALPSISFGALTSFAFISGNRSQTTFAGTGGISDSGASNTAANNTKY
jgi:hypothetical protein